MTVASYCGGLNGIQEQLTRLLDDIRALRGDKGPGAIDLAGAPLVDQWSIGLVPAPCIVGTVVGHPIFRNRTRVHTQQMILIDPDAGWARTWSGFYRLGARQALESGDDR
jgi:hypothetical protein